MRGSLVMPARPANFSQAAVARALKAATAAGITVGAYEIGPDGVIRVYAQGEAPEPKPTRPNSWDDE